MVTFRQAYEAAAARYEREWRHLTPSEMTKAIYEEMRRLDAEAAGRNVLAGSTSSKRLKMHRLVISGQMEAA